MCVSWITFLCTQIPTQACTLTWQAAVTMLMHLDSHVFTVLTVCVLAFVRGVQLTVLHLRLRDGCCCATYVLCV